MKDVKKYFDAHPTVNELHFTGDGLGFFKENDAYNHARRIKSEVKTHTRAEVEAWAESKAAKEISSEGGNDSQTDYALMTQKQLQEACHAKGIEYKKSESKDALLQKLKA